MSDNLDKHNIDGNNLPDPDYWRSFRELFAKQKELKDIQDEKSDKTIDDLTSTGLNGISRRKFFALLGASAALAGTGCSDYRDKGTIIPYNSKPEDVIVGKANYYASSCDVCANNCGVLIKTREGRPIKIEGNPDNPVNKGKICAKGQANILNLYDPERVKTPLVGNNGLYSEISWKKVDKEITAALKEASAKGKTVAVICGVNNSPTFSKIIEEFKNKYAAVKFYFYEVFNNQTRNSAWFECYGEDNYPAIRWNEAKVILSLEGDFLGTEGNKLEASRLFAENRNVDSLKEFNRLYCVEGDMSLTGMNADYRIKLRPDYQLEFVLSLLNEIILKRKVSHNISNAGLFNKISGYSLTEFAESSGISKKTMEQLVTDLIGNKGKGFVYAGNSLSRDVHVAVNLLNEVLENKTLYNTEAQPVHVNRLSDKNGLNELVADMNSGKTSIVIHFDSNPVFTMPANLKYEQALRKVGLVISLTSLENESSLYAKYVLSINHTLESWNDYKTRSGFIGLQQPVIAPLYNTRQKEAVLLNWLAQETDNYSEKIYYDYLISRWEKEVYPAADSILDFKEFMNASLHDGVAKQKDTSKSSLSFNTACINDLPERIKRNTGLVLILKESYSLGDGRNANNGWLQELPHPVTKITWDNYAAISTGTAKKYNLKDNDLIEIIIDKNKATLPVYVQPGMADDTISVQLGYGRTRAGVIGMGVGHNANTLLLSNSGTSNWIHSWVLINKTGGKYKLISSQEKYDFDNETTKEQHLKRGIIKEGTVHEYKRNREFIREKSEEKHESIFNAYEYKGVKWGMSIDLNKCTGCTDCITACNVENNIPVVGKDQVEKGRSMQWLRIDRYYSGNEEEPVPSYQPMLCQHCDKATCEQVCPVAATSHSPDGLNQMVYNRCVGTRYCSNNCPYKVRRFNFFNFRNHFRDGIYEKPVVELLHNPEVTVRSRGVMEKCTFCIQRIMEAREEATRNKTTIKGSDVRTACQDACGTDAIKFGDINDEKGEFYKYRNHELGYYVLEETNTKPNVTYIAKLRNIAAEVK